MARIKYYDPETNEWKYADSNAIVNITGYATEIWVQDNYQEKGNYLTEVPAGYAKTEDIPTEQEIIQLIEEHAPESSGGGIAVTGATVGQTVKISAVDENGVPTAWLPADFPIGGGGGSGGGDVWEEITTITLEEDTTEIDITQDKNGNTFSLKKLFAIFIPAYNDEGKTTGKLRTFTDDGLIDISLSDSRTQSVVFYMDEMRVVGSTHYDDAFQRYDTFTINTMQVGRWNVGKPISFVKYSYPNQTYYTGTKITVWGVRA